MSDRIILHCDCNSFFASVETVLAPELARVPMAVAGDAEARRGIILAKNELAKRYGIETAETIYSAKRKCPSLVLVPPHHKEYAQYSAAVRRIFERYTDLIEPFGIDEAWLDVTGSQALFGSGEEIAHAIRESVKRELGITVSVGVSFNKPYAKLGSDYKKPDAVTVISRENYKDIVYPLHVRDLLFVGKQTASALSASGIYTIGELAAASVSFLTSRFGKMGEMLSLYARGEDNSPVSSFYEVSDVKSVSNSMTFKRDLSTLDEVHMGIATLAEEVAYRLRKKGMRGSTVAITVKDSMLKSITRQAPISPATHLSSEIAEAAYALARGVFGQGKAIRMLTVGVTGLLHDEDAVEQLGFFDEPADSKRERREKLESAVDGIRARFGHSVLTAGAVIGNDIGIETNGKHKKN